MGEGTFPHNNAQREFFLTIPGSPAYEAKFLRYRVKNAALGLEIGLEGANAIQGSLLFEG